MKLPVDKLTTHLSKGIAPIYFVSSDDPLVSGEVTDAIRKAAREQGYEERESHSASARFDWSRLLGGMDNLSLFATRKIVEVRLETGKPGREGGAALVDLVNNPPEDTMFIITSPKLDSSSAKTKWAKTLQEEAVWIAISPVTPEQLPGWLAGRARRAGLELEAEALELLAARVEGNLMAAQQELDKLVLLDGPQPVTAEVVRQSVADGARFDVFQLADAALGQDAARAARILGGLQKEGVAPALTLWAVAREINGLLTVWSRVDQGTRADRAMNEARVWKSRQGLMRRALAGHDESSIRRLVAKASLTDRIVKGARPGQPWNALLELVLCLARPGQSGPAGYEA